MVTHRIGAPVLPRRVLEPLVAQHRASAWYTGVRVLMMYLIFAMTLYLSPPQVQ